MAAALLGLAASLVRRQALDDPVAGKHAAIDREVPANHKGTHGRILLRQGVGLVLQISLVLPPIHQDEARVAIGIAVAFIRGVMPPTPPAEACKTSRLALVLVHYPAGHTPLREGKRGGVRKLG